MLIRAPCQATPLSHRAVLLRSVPCTCVPQAALDVLQVASWFVDRYLHIQSKARYIMPKHGVEGVHGMSTLDVQRAKMVGTIPGRLNPQNKRAEPARLSRVMRRGGEHELADDSERARSVNRDDAQSGQELQPLLDKSQ
jgi:hypothetical protein